MKTFACRLDVAKPVSCTDRRRSLMRRFDPNRFSKSAKTKLKGKCR